MAFIIDGTTGIATVDGSVAAPSQRGQDSNSGISYAADTIKFSTGGVERMSITNSGVTGITAGITMADSWRLSSNFTQGNNVRELITSNWERVDSDSYGAIGSPMTQSSGTFTFPVTGIYLISLQSMHTNTAGAATQQSYIDVTTNNSSYSDASLGVTRVPSSYKNMNLYIQFIFDVTDTSTHKVQFAVYSDVNNSITVGQSNRNQTAATFIKIGDT